MLFLFCNIFVLFSQPALARQRDGPRQGEATAAASNLVTGRLPQRALRRRDVREDAARLQVARAAEPRAQLCKVLKREVQLVSGTT